MHKTGIIVLAAATALVAAETRSDDLKRISEAARVFKEIQNIPASGIPDTLVSDSHAIIIVPALKRAGFIFGGEYGKGVFLARLPNGSWSAPSTVSVEGGSFGAQIGVGETDLVMLAMNDDAVQHLMKSGVKIGADVMGAIGPVGRTMSAATTPVPTSGLLAYSRARGAFAGATLNGTTLRSDDKANELVYGHPVTQHAILTGAVKPVPEAVPLIRELDRYHRPHATHPAHATHPKT